MRFSRAVLLMTIAGALQPASAFAFAVPPLLCGNMVIDQGETCDDGNLIDGDGCSSLCIKELDGGTGDAESPDAVPVDEDAAVAEDAGDGMDAGAPQPDAEPSPDAMAGMDRAPAADADPAADAVATTMDATSGGGMDGGTSGALDGDQRTGDDGLDGDGGCGCSTSSSSSRGAPVALLGLMFVFSRARSRSLRRRLPGRA